MPTKEHAGPVGSNPSGKHRAFTQGRLSMIVRREFVFGAAAAGVVMQPRLSFSKASQPATGVSFDVPEGACDCHTHIHGDPAKFPWFAERTYTPEMALPD